MFIEHSYTCPFYVNISISTVTCKAPLTENVNIGIISYFS